MINNLIIYVIALSSGFGSLNHRICESDGKSTFENREIMVGEKLTIIFQSDDANYHSGGLFISSSHAAKGIITARDNEPNTIDCENSHLVSAGETARVIPWEDSNIKGCDMYGATGSCAPGDWFVLDYTATKTGQVQLFVYDYQTGFANPSETITLNQVKSRDFNTDNIVNLTDYIEFTNHYGVDNYSDPNTYGKYDLNDDGSIEVMDLVLFSDFWLNGAPAPEPIRIDETVRYKIVDALGNNSVSMSPGDSGRFYVDLETTDANDIGIFDIEVQISDTSLGYIDNRVYDPNDTTAYSAEILATPFFFGVWDQGKYQSQGIEFNAATLGTFNDGHLASFVYTCSSTEPATLTVFNILTKGQTQIQPATENMYINPADQSAVEMSTNTEALGSECDSDEIIDFLNDIYDEDASLREQYTPSEWEVFVTDVASSCN